MTAARKPASNSEMIRSLGAAEIPTQSNPHRLFGWYPDPSAQLEIVRFNSGDTSSYKSYCVLPWRPAIRPPMKDIESERGRSLPD